MANYDLGQLVFKITGDNSGFKKSMDDTKKSATGVGNVLKSIATIVSSVGLASFFSKASKAASDAEETTSKFNVVFSKIKPIAESTAQALSDAYGLGITESKGLLSATGNLLQGFGMTQEASLAVSDVIQRLSGDLVSMTNYSGGVKGASEALTKALLGETEQAKSLGLAIGDEQLRNFGLRLGKDTEKMSLQEKAMLRIKLAVDQSKNALGDYAGTSESFANSMRRLDQRLTGIMEGIGKEINPEIGKMARLFLVSSESGGLLSDSINAITKAAASAIKGFAVLAYAVEKAYNSAKLYNAENDKKRVKENIDIIITQASAYGLINKELETSTKRTGQYTKVIEELNKSSDPKARQLADSLKKEGQALGQATQAMQANINKSNDLADISDELANKSKANTDADKKRAAATADLNKKITEAEALAAKGGQKAIDKDQLKLAQSTKDMGLAWANATPELRYFVSQLNGKNEASLKSSLEDIEGLPPQVATAIMNMSKVSGQEMENISAKIKAGLNIQDDIDLWGKLSPEIQASIVQLQTYLRLNPEFSKQLLTVKSMAPSIADMGKEWDKLDFNGKAAAINANVQTVTGAITGLMQAMIDLNNAQLQTTLNNLDYEMQARLEAAGVAEETAVQQAQAEYDAAVAGGDAQTIADRQRILTKAKIEEEYNKKKAKAEYDSQVRSWELQRQMAMIQMLAAPLNAYVSALATPIIGFYIAPIVAGLALAAASLQYAAVAQAKPQAPKFASGGIVPGNSFSGDKVQANVNSGEMVLNAEQQGQLFDIASGKGSGGNQIFRVAPIDKQVFYDDLYKASQDGRLYIAERAVQ